MGLKHQEAGEAAHPVDVGETFQLGVTGCKLSVICYQKPQEATSDQRSATRRRKTRPLCCYHPPRTSGFLGAERLLTHYVSVKGRQEQARIRISVQ